MTSIDQQHIFFPQGLVGFESFQRFEIQAIPQTALMQNFFSLQSADKPDLRFYVYIPIPSPYSFSELQPWASLYGVAEEDIATMILVTIRRDINAYHFTGNFYAPILVNKNSSHGWQVILSDSSYSLRETILSVPTKETIANVVGS